MSRRQYILDNPYRFRWNRLRAIPNHDDDHKSERVYEVRREVCRISTVRAPFCRSPFDPVDRELFEHRNVSYKLHPTRGVSVHRLLTHIRPTCLLTRKEKRNAKKKARRQRKKAAVRIQQWFRFHKKSLLQLRTNVVNKECFYTLEKYDYKQFPGPYFYHVVNKNVVYEFNAAILATFIQNAETKEAFNPFTKQSFLQIELKRLNRVLKRGPPFGLTIPIPTNKWKPAPYHFLDFTPSVLALPFFSRFDFNCDLNYEFFAPDL